MVGATTHHQQQQQQAPQLAPPSSSSSSAAPTTSPEEDEFLKRNTDCVYFLASPLTCKKGSECEYRHSDIARVNPRDCWYWLNGNCLNPKCAFRHPPLDGLLGAADVSTPMAVAPPTSLPTLTPHPAPYPTPKQGVACIFFQKGFCLKGHLCPFLHGPPNSVNNKPAQPGSANPVTDPPKMSIQDQKFTPPETAQKPVEFKGRQPPPPARNGGNKRERVVLPPVMGETLPTNPNPSVNHGYYVSENERVLNVKDADEYSRDPSPGFDVLVDNQVEDSEYYRENDEFVRSRGQDYDVDHDHRDFDHYNEREGQFAWDESRESSGRMLVGSAHQERRPYPRSDSPDHLDLRHRISNQRRVSENTLDRRPRRDSHHHDHHHHNRRQEQGGALSSRLRGRIKIPGRSVSPSNENSSRVEREIDMGRRHQSRYSPGRPLSLNSRVRDRIKDNNGDNDTKFAGPKRLSELKSGRTSEVLEDGEILGKRKYPKVEDNLSFEGPKPLSEILKRKRRTDSDNRISSVIIEEKNKKEEIVKEEEHIVLNDFEAEKQTEEDGKSYANDEVNEGEMVDEDALLDEELEGYDDHGDGDYEYDQIDGEEDYNLDEGEFVDEEYEEKELVENN
ncbi:unnamed protein product [Lactuca saligna]|uniref:C3H1-type domain-containing protein n=1 Tax=Lactuca saligna TaxID=75948 RepID=A0AA35VAY6_LACSI|nr:unnamed protein product [Lactuca saligna]